MLYRVAVAATRMRACHGRLVLGSRPTAPSFLSKSHSRLASTAVALAPPASTPPAVRDSSPLPTAANSKSPLERELDTYLAMDSATRKATYSRDRLRHLLRRMFDASRGKRIAPAPEAVLCVFRDLQHALGSIHESSIEDYNAVLHFLVRYRRPAADLLKIMASVQQLSAAGAPIALDGETIYQLVCGLVNTGNLSKAHDVLEFAHDKSIDVGVHTYSILVKGFLKRGVYALEAMPADLRQASTRTQADLVSATNIAMDMIKRDVKMDSTFFLTFMYSYGKLLDDEGCRYWLSLAERLDRIALTPLYNILIDTYCKLGDLRSALQTLEKMKESKLNADRLRPDAYTYGSIMQLVSAMPRSPVSLADLFREMKRLGIAPTIDNWNVIMWNYAKHGHVRKVEQFWERLREQPALKPNQLTFNTMLVAYATLVNDQAGRPTVTEIYKAIADGSYMKDRSKTPMFVQTSNVPVSQKVLKSAVDKCQYYYREMLSAGVTPNAKSVNSMLQVLIRGRQPSEAIRLFRNVEERFLSRVDIAMMQKQQQERQQFTLQQHEEVRTLRERFETDKKRRMDKEGEVAASPFPADDDLDADFVVPKALATSEDEVLDRNVANPRAVVDIITYNTMVALHLRFKDFASATALLETSMPRASVQPNSWTYTLLLDRARACGRDDVVEKCVEDLVRIRKERGVLLGGLVVGDGPLHRQLKIIQKMDRDKLPLTDETLQSIEWLKTSARLANDKYHRTQNKRKSSAKGATGLDALNGSAKR